MLELNWNQHLHHVGCETGIWQEWKPKSIAKIEIWCQVFEAQKCNEDKNKEDMDSYQVDKFIANFPLLVLVNNFIMFLLEQHWVACLQH